MTTASASEKFLPLSLGGTHRSSLSVVSSTAEKSYCLQGQGTGLDLVGVSIVLL